MYKAGPDADLCRHCGRTMFEHPMSKRRYYNNPDTRAFFEAMDSTPWWLAILGTVLFICWAPVVLVARLFGWRPRDDD